MWVLFTAPTGEQTAREMYEKRLTWITDDMRASARELGCTFHRAWYAAASSRVAEGDPVFWPGVGGFAADASSRREVAIFLEGDVGLVPLGGD